MHGLGTGIMVAWVLTVFGGTLYAAYSLPPNPTTRVYTVFAVCTSIVLVSPWYVMKLLVSLGLL